MADVPITDFGAVADGETLCTSSIQAAIDAAAETGGRVIVPAGVFRSGTINLRSHVTLHLSEGATLLGSENLDDYEFARGWGWPHDEKKCDVTPWHFVQAFDAEHVAITGLGTIAGSGRAFWQDGRPHEWAFWKHIDNQRPAPMVHLENCSHVTVCDVMLRDSPGWCLHLTRCRTARVSGVTIRNTFFGPNSDGMDIHNCSGVRISDCDVATGDDAIALMSSRHGGPSEDITITNCVLRTSCVGVRLIGFDADGLHRRVAVSNCAIPRCAYLFDLRSQMGSRIENVTISNCVGATNSGWPINRAIQVAAIDHLNPHSTDHNPTGQGGHVRDVTFRDIDITTDGRVILAASAPHCIEDIRFDGLRMNYSMIEDSRAFEQAHPDGSWLDGDHLDVRSAQAAIVAKDVRNLDVAGLSVRWPEYPVPDEWRVLKSDQRFINASFYEGNEEAIRTGRKRGEFALLWGKGLEGGCIELPNAQGSEGGPATVLDECTCEISHQ
ncbi:MAG: glycoside hydrolase family 28 protein [Planctomycetota bacterium]